MKISRVHIHPYGSFVMCYDKKKWEDGLEAIIKSSLAMPGYCLLRGDVEDNLDNFELLPMPSEIEVPGKKDKI